MSSFGPAGTNGLDCTSFINETFDKLTSIGAWSTKPSISWVLLSGHSGGGGHIASMFAEPNQPRLPSPLRGLFLFEAINGTNELAADMNWLLANLDSDLAAIKNAAAQGADAQASYVKGAFIFRGFYNAQDSFYSPHYSALQASFDTWFSNSAGELGGAGSDLYKALYANYQIVLPHPYVEHDTLVDAGNLELALSALP